VVEPGAEQPSLVLALVEVVAPALGDVEGVGEDRGEPAEGGLVAGPLPSRHLEVVVGALLARRRRRLVLLVGGGAGHHLWRRLALRCLFTLYLQTRGIEAAA